MLIAEELTRCEASGIGLVSVARVFVYASGPVISQRYDRTIVVLSSHPAKRSMGGLNVDTRKPLGSLL